MITITHKTPYDFPLKVRKGSFMDLHLAEQGETSGDPVGCYAKAESELVKVILRRHRPFPNSMIWIVFRTMEASRVKEK